MAKHIGITGGIGSGKSTICHYFKTLGIPVYDADHWAKWLMANDEDIRTALINAFGSEIFPDGQLDRVALGKQVFGNEAALNQLNAITHPPVRQHYLNWLKSHEAKPYTIKEAALMFEAGTYHDLDATINVVAPVEVRMARVQARDSFRTKEQIEAIIAKQWTDEQRAALATFEILNDGSQPLLPQLFALEAKIAAL